MLGDIFDAKEGEKLFIKGEWEKHSTFGDQLKIDCCEKIVPTSRDNAVSMLSSGMIKGVGPSTARNIVDTLGTRAIEVVLEQPERLTEVKGIGEKKAKSISRKVAETYEAQKAVSFLVSLGVTPKTSYRIFKKFGRSTIDYVRKNPYCIVEVNQLGFYKADEIAANLGIKKDSPFRVKAGVHFMLNSALWDEGHTYLPKNELTDRVLKLLNKECECVSDKQVVQGVNTSGEIINHSWGVSLKWVFYSEARISKNIKRLCKKLSSIVPEPVLKCYEKKESIELTVGQKKAVEMALNYGFFILTGGPGVGKTATVKAVISTFKKIFPGAEIMLAAPTGRAARKLAEVSGVYACTLHKLLEIGRDSKPVKNKGNPLDCDMLIVDESSMLDIILDKNLTDALKSGTRVLFIGDIDQLPSVGPGNVLRDMLACKKIPRIELKEVFRQAAESQIIYNAHRINRGKNLLINEYKKDFFFLDREEPSEIVKAAVHVVKNLGYKSSDVQVLSPMKKGPAGTQELNSAIQKAVNPEGKEIQNTSLRLGDRVIQTRNNYNKKVFNGDIGIIKRVEDDRVFIQFNGHETEFNYKELNDVEIGYSITIHKSQGSEYRAVVIPLTTSHYIMLARNLIYTGITRAQEKVVLVGTRKALNIAIRNNKPVNRYTLLSIYLNKKGVKSIEG